MSSKTGPKPRTDTPRERAEALSALIRRHEHLYYVLDRPEVSDDEYDGLVSRAEGARRGARAVGAQVSARRSRQNWHRP